jgi:arginyl-tRNA synthetase
LGNKIGNYLVENVAEVSRFNVVFLNIVISDEYYLNSFNRMKDDTKFGFVTPNPEDTAVMVEYSSPNTNKPLHLGHVRNNLLGYSVAEIIKASGKKNIKLKSSMIEFIFANQCSRRNLEMEKRQNRQV